MAPPFCSIAGFRSLGFRLRFELLDLLALILDFLLLRLYLLLGLRVGVFLVLHRIPNYVASAAAHNTSNRGARERMTYGGTYDCSSSCAQCRASYGAFFTSRERLPRASGYNQRTRER